MINEVFPFWGVKLKFVHEKGVSYQLVVGKSND